MNTYRCSGFTAKGQPCPKETTTLWHGLLALCPNHAERVRAHISRAKKEAVDSYVEDMHRTRRENAARRAESNKPVVYFIGAGHRIKIGTSIRPEARLSQIRVGSTKRPLGLDTSKARILATVPGGVEEEYALHQKFAHLRDAGEWFKAAPELKDYIREVAA